MLVLVIRMSEFIYGFYAFAYYINDRILSAVSNPFNGILLELLIPIVTLLCVLVMNRIITAKQLVFLSILFSLIPVIMKKIVVGSVTDHSDVWLEGTDFLVIGLFFTIGVLLLIAFLFLWFFFETNWEIDNKKWLGTGFLALSGLFIVPSSSVMFAFLSMKPNHDYEPEVAFQWYGQLLATQTVLLLILVTIPAFCGIMPKNEKYTLPHLAINLIFAGLLLYSLTWVVDYTLYQIVAAFRTILLPTGG